MASPCPDVMSNSFGPKSSFKLSSSAWPAGACAEMDCLRSRNLNKNVARAHLPARGVELTVPCPAQADAGPPSRRLRQT